MNISLILLIFQKTKQDRKAKKCFSLLELVICMGLIALTASLFGVKGVQLYQHHRRLHEMDALLEEIQLTDSLANSFRADIYLTLHMDKKKLIMHRECDEPVLAKMQNTFLKPKIFSHLSINETIVIHYYGNGWPSTPRKIKVSGMEKNL